MRVSHEVPLCLLEHSRSFNDFDYALVHLFERYPTYFDFFKKSLLAGREVILDNSVFELGSPFDEEIYYRYINELRPTYTIIPDKFENCDFTIKKVIEWAPKLKSLGLKSIGVIQGSTLYEFKYCYKALSEYVDKIAISFAQPLFSLLYNELDIDNARMRGRFFLINFLIDEGVIDYKKKHHLLGLSLPQEVYFYNDIKYNFIDSVDSSSPIVHGIKGISFDSNGLSKKEHIKLVDLFDISYGEISQNMDIINKNINFFKQVI